MDQTGSLTRRLACRSLTAVVAVLPFILARAVAAAPGDPVLDLQFEGSLHDTSGQGNDAFVEQARYEPGRQGQGLRLRGRSLTVADCADLRLAPGLQFEVWVQFATVHGGIQPIVVKEREYMLRVDPRNEGGQFSFFAFFDNWEPRVRSSVVAEPGQWYHVVAGWDGASIHLTVNGVQSRLERTGQPVAGGQPLTVGPMDGVVDALRLVNPGAAQTGVAYWPFDDHLRDVTGRGHDLVADGALAFDQGRVSRAVQVGPGLRTPSSVDLQLAAGFRIDCAVMFDAAPTGFTTIVRKEGEYLLRVDNPQEGGRFSFFVNLGRWEPRVQSKAKVEPGVWYRLVAQWDGRLLSLTVNGERTYLNRAGLPQAGDEPLEVGPLPGRIDDLRIENPRLPVLRVKSLSQANTLLCAGRPEGLTAEIENVGAPARDAVVRLDPQPGAQCVGPAEHALGDLETGAARTVEWVVSADRAVTAVGTIWLTAADYKAPEYRRELAFFESIEAPVLPVIGEPSLAPATTWYIDSQAGDNARAGTSPETAWRDFTPVNGKVLGPGDRLLLKRGSVFGQELQVSAAGTPERWAEIGVYGEGPRPIIRRNWDIAERCVLVRNPNYLVIRSLVVSHAGKGLIVTYGTTGHAGLVIEDCVAHHIEGLYRGNAHGIPEWRDRLGAPGDPLHSSAGIGVVGAPATDIVVRDCEMFQCSWGFFITGHAVTVDRVYCHDNFVHNTSPHPALVNVKRSFLQNSIFDASGYHASAGTMGIMLVNPQGLVVRNCVFRNQPDSGSHDQGGIDFEAHGAGCLVEQCTFERNAGAAIEVLGLKSPQPRNVEIARNRFIQNNLALKLGPSEIYIWGKSPNPEVCCSTGLIHGNGYATAPGVEFYVNEAPTLTDWTLSDNTAYPTVEALRQAMPFNEPPVVEAGRELWVDQPRVELAGVVSDDGLPGPLAVRWEVLDGPGPVRFDDGSKAATAAHFGAPGDYLLRLVADDGELWLSDLLAVHVLPAGHRTVAAWDFNRPLDKEGWTEVNPGTVPMPWPQWETRSEPVQHVAGGYYVLAVEDSRDAHWLSPDQLGLDLGAVRTVRFRLQNHTPATSFRLRYTTSADPRWDDWKSVVVPVTALDQAPRVYVVALPLQAGATGTLKQLRLDLATGEPLTGTCRLDYVWVGSGPNRE